MPSFEQISYAKTVYGQEEIDAVVKCLGESTQMGNYSRKFESEIAKFLVKNTASTLILGLLHYLLELRRSLSLRDLRL